MTKNDAIPESERALVEEGMQIHYHLFKVMETIAFPRWLKLDLTMVQMKAVMILAHSDPMTVSHLAELLHTGQPAASILVDRLVHLGYVERNDDPADRRRALVQLSSQGKEVVNDFRHYRMNEMRAWTSRLSNDDLAALVQGLRALTTIIAADTAHLDCGWVGPEDKVSP